MNAVVINGKYDPVDYTVSHESPQSGQGGGRDICTSTSASRQDHDGRDEAGPHDGSTLKDGSSTKTQIIERGASSLLKTELLPRSHGTSNLSVIRVSLFRTLGKLVRQARDFLIISR